MQSLSHAKCTDMVKVVAHTTVVESFDGVSP